jgi:hypothetical protein
MVFLGDLSFKNIELQKQLKDKQLATATLIYQDAILHGVGEYVGEDKVEFRWKSCLTNPEK